ncbi:MAG: hypothetical protein MUF64_10550 [Polyangiaceae bacterium]|jgi:hypothetical protein|nr:hypothetical protein [Polyangiaceae bacterium]
MLGDLLRRLLWVPPLALLASLLVFSLISPDTSATSAAFRHLPRFFNGAPEDTVALSTRAVASLRERDDPEAAALLARLGGAAFPVVLPALEGLSPAGRRRVALALRPVASRMKLALPPGELEQDALWWRRFWEDRSLDFQAPTVRRLARRYATSPSEARRLELRMLDTAALPELFAVLGTEGLPPPVELSSALVPVIQEVLGRPAVPVEQLPQEILALRAFWFAHQLEFSTLDGAGRASALLLETQYGKWVQRTLMQRASRAPRATGVVTSPLWMLARRGPWTLARVLLGLGLGLAVAWALERARRPWLHTAAVGGALGGAPAVLALAPPSEGSALGLIVLVAGAGWVTLRGDARESELHRPFFRVARAWGGAGVKRRPWGESWRGVVLLQGQVVAAALLGEWRWRLPGLGVPLVRALQEQDATLLMTLVVANLGVLQVASVLFELGAQAGGPRGERR